MIVESNPADTPSRIKALIGRPYDTVDPWPCWCLCREVMSMIGVELPASPREGLVRIERPVVPCIALFRVPARIDWHAGVVWPDGLHFLHAVPQSRRAGGCTVRQDRLTIWPWNRLFEGYYLVGERLGS